jgi:surface protein
MSNNLDFGRTGSVQNITVYGPTGTIQPNPVRFPNAYLTAPIYDLSNNIVGANGPKLNIYRSIPETRYPFTYIGTPNISNYGLFGQINPDAYTPKISVYQQVQGTLVFSYDYSGNLSLVNLASVTYLPIITGINNALTIVNSNATKTGNRVTVTVNISYIDDGSNFGLSFYEKTFFNSNSTASNVQIIALTNIPLARNGNQFTSISGTSLLFASNTVVPTILPNTSLSRCFYKCSNFDSDISGWTTSNVTDMSYMFSGGWYSNGKDTNDDVLMIFNKDISNWNTSNVKNMSVMFACAKYNTFFNKNISNWNTSKVENMSIMFARCNAFNNGSSSNDSSNPLTTIGNNWNTSSVTTMHAMFYGCSAFNQNINNWNTSSVTTMHAMFAYCSVFNQNIGNWTTSIVSNMANMFYKCTVFNNGGSANPKLSNWDTSRVTDMQYMFYECTLFNQNIGYWTTSNVTDMQYMFYGCTVFNNGGSTNPKLSSWDTSCVTDMQYMFYNCFKFNGKILVNTSLVQNISYMFYGCTIFNNSGGLSNTTNALSSASSSKTGTSTWTWTPLSTDTTWYNNWHGPTNAALGTAGYCGLSNANAPTQLRAKPYW